MLKPARALLLAAVFCTSSVAAQQSVRVVSMNVCADQLLLELAAPEQLIALSELSRDVDAAYHHRRAQAYANTRPTAEQVLALRPTLVIASNYGQQHTISLLEQQGIRVETMPIAQTLDQMFANILQVGDWLGTPLRSRKLVATLEARLDALPAASAPKPVAAIFDANGYTVGAASLRGQMLELAGFANLASRIGISHYGKISLEILLAQQPQVIVDSPYASGTYSRAQTLPKHPALRRSELAPAVIPLAVNGTICAGPWTIDNIEKLAKFRVSMQTSGS